MKRILKCEEWAKLRIGEGLELSSFDELTSILHAWKKSTGKNTDAYFDIYAGALVPKFWTGTLETSKLILEVVPIGANLLDQKNRTLLDNNLSRMLENAISSSFITAGLAPLSTDGNKFDSLLGIFCDELQLARRRQVIRRYISSSDSLSSPRGRITFPEQCYENIRRPGRFASSWVALTEDVPENRIFKEVLLRYRSRCSANIRGIIDLCLSDMDSVNISPDYRLEWPKVRTDRLSATYHSLLRQSQSLLEERGIGIFVGDELATSEIIFTYRLFEAFIAKELNWIATSEGLIAKTQARGTFACSSNDGEGVFELIPDVRLINNEGATELIIDTKWKFLHMNKRNLGISREDIYQMLTYGMRFNCMDIVLLYPDVTSETGNKGVYHRFDTFQEQGKYSLHVVKIPMLANSLLAIRDVLKKVVMISRSKNK
ncbi:TPA: hypothetical protein SI557_000266 [Escherichia coli]|uniref:McrC family protein n=1 Tax=Enterobacteriaceae TaxID=543 RepID=UPI00184B37CB|nr:hypothetical protein [Escherichia coli]ELY6199877.1 hypothetical protein [Cronobacter sakazakii]MBJ8889679.1 hypothetical protein [Citrobacter sp. FDAARGOS_156]MED9399439.1 hypothetical protein [Escherichia marmotae]HEO1572532.1 hypothetical protein [Klebsiella aerogenes]